MDEANTHLFVAQTLQEVQNYRAITGREQSSSKNEEQENSQEQDEQEEDVTWEEIHVNRPVAQQDEGILTAHLRARTKAKSMHNPRQYMRARIKSPAPEPNIPREGRREDCRCHQEQLEAPIQKRQPQFITPSPSFYSIALLSAYLPTW